MKTCSKTASTVNWQALALDGQAEHSVYSTSKPQKRRSTAKSMMNLSIDFRSHFIAEVFQMESFKLWSWPCHTYYYSITHCVFIVSYSFMTKLRVNVLLLTPESTVEIDRNNCIWNYGSKYLLYIRHGSHCSVLHKTKRNIFFRIFLFSFFAGSPILLTLSLPDRISNTPYCLPYNSRDVGSENLALDQPIIPR